MEFNLLLKVLFFSKSYRLGRKCLKIHKSFRLQTRNTSVEFKRRDLVREYPEIQILFDQLCWVWIQKTSQEIPLMSILRPELINFINQNIMCWMKDNLKWEHHCLIHFDHHQNGQREAWKTNHLSNWSLILLAFLPSLIVNLKEISFFLFIVYLWLNQLKIELSGPTFKNHLHIRLFWCIHPFHYFWLAQAQNRRQSNRPPWREKEILHIFKVKTLRHWHFQSFLLVSFHPLTQFTTKTLSHMNFQIKRSKAILYQNLLALLSLRVCD